MIECFYSCKGEINFNAAKRNDLGDDLTARWSRMFQSPTSLTKNVISKHQNKEGECG